MITYELAKELKDAGFPQNKRNDTISFYETTDGKSVKQPGLSELIEACGKGLRYLFQDNNGNWEAAEGTLVGRQLGHAFSVSSPKPDVAVARLWLALNKK